MIRRYTKALYLTFLILTLLPAGVYSQDPPVSDRESAWDLTQLLGMNPSQVHEILGPPAEVYTLQVTEKFWQPVFYYSSQVYAFFHQNRIWQIRLDRRYSDGFQGLVMNLPLEEVRAMMGPPKAEQTGSLIYDLPYRNFPRRMRLVFTEGKLSDIFIYRSDF